MRLFLAGSHTDIGKTSVGAALCYGFGFEYFKLIQAGIPTDNARIQTLSPKTKIHPSGITLQTPISPHIAMQKEKINYQGLAIPLPKAQNLLIESAGGLFSPLDLESCMIDYLEHSKLPCLLVGGYYLGGINHILLSITALKMRKIDLLGLVISKSSDKEASQMDQFIIDYVQSTYGDSIKIAHFPTFNQENFKELAKHLCRYLQEFKILNIANH